MPDLDARDPEALARALVADNSYLTLATVGSDGTPWATPVWFAARGLSEFVWASKPGARHSTNLATEPRVSLVVFDSSRAPGDGSALYVTALAAEVDGTGFDSALQVYNERSAERGLSGWSREQLGGSARHRLYRARSLDAFVLDDHDERIPLGSAMT